MTPVQALCYEQHRNKWVESPQGPRCPICGLDWDQLELRFIKLEVRLGVVEAELRNKVDY